MSQNDRYASAAASRIRRAWRESRGRLAAAPRDSVVAAERALRSRRRRRVMVAWTLPVLATSMAVAGVAVVFRGWPTMAHRPRGVASLAGDPRALILFDAPAGADSAAHPVRALGAGDQVFAPHTTAVALGDAAGTQLTVEPGGNLTVLDAGAQRRFALRRGAVNARVRKLVAGERFIIETADSEIEVHGTAFRVELGTPTRIPCAGPGPFDSVSTRVAVSEGVVTVKWSGDEQRLRPGDEWPPRCPPAGATPPATVAAESTQVAAAPASARFNRAAVTRGARRNSARAAATRQATASRAISVASALVAQNDLFQSAALARRNGQGARALALFNRYLQEYPEGSLFESALAQKMRLLAAAADLSGATAAAGQYLGRFPDGFARDEARAVLGASARP